MVSADSEEIWGREEVGIWGKVLNLEGLMVLNLRKESGKVNNSVPGWEN